MAEHSLDSSEGERSRLRGSSDGLRRKKMLPLGVLWSCRPLKGKNREGRAGS